MPVVCHASRLPQNGEDEREGCFDLGGIGDLARLLDSPGNQRLLTWVHNAHVFAFLRFREPMQVAKTMRWSLDP